MTAWFQKFNQREQSLLMVAAVLALIVILLFLVIKPIHNFRNQARTDLGRAQDQFTLVQRSVVAVDTQTTTNSNKPIRNTILNSAAIAKLTINSLNNRQNGALQIILSETDSQSLFKWLADLEQNEQIIVSRATIRKAGGSGLVRADLEFKKKN